MTIGDMQQVREMSTNAVFIPSKGRPECKTAQYLYNIGYPGEWHIVLGDDDGTIDEYRAAWGEDRLIVFDKAAELANTDFMDAWADTRPSGVAPARNFIARYAKEHGLARFWLFDDDYKSFSIKKDEGEVEIESGKRLFDLFDEIEEFGISTGIPVVGVLARDWTKDKTSRCSRIYNGHNLATNGFWPFKARMFDDSVHALMGMRVGCVDFGFCHMHINLVGNQFRDSSKTGNMKGGMFEVYDECAEYGDGERRHLAQIRDIGYQVMACPSGLRITLKNESARIAHNDMKLAPKILGERHRR